MYSNDSYPGLASSSNNINLFRKWNHPNEYYSCTDSFPRRNPHVIKRSCDDKVLLEKFQNDTLVKLETGEIKNIQQLTTNDLLSSAKQSDQYSSLSARVEYIGSVDKLTGKAELRFHIKGIEKTISYYVLQEMPFFVHQYSSWSSISPEYTRRIYGLNCRQLECEDLILALTEQGKKSSTFIDQPDYTQQSPAKCLVERYMNEKISTSKEIILGKNKRFKISNE